MITGWALTGEPAQRRGMRSVGTVDRHARWPDSGLPALTRCTLGIPILWN